jgi:hypothetical protein
MKEVNVGAMIRLKNARHMLTKNQYDTLYRKIQHGDPAGAMKKLRMLLLLQGSNAVKNDVSRETRNIKK